MSTGRKESAMTKEIPLAHGKVAIVDDADYEWLMQWKWSAWTSRYHTTWYVKRDCYFPKGRRQRIYMHRLILDAAPGTTIDHIDCNGLNNTRSNLRFASHAENVRNRGVQSNNTSGYKGVTFDKQKERWVALIFCENVKYYLGQFDSVEDAAAAYDKAALELHGAFANTNASREYRQLLAQNYAELR